VRARGYPSDGLARLVLEPIPEACVWIRHVAAAARGSSLAMHNLGVAHLKGAGGFPQDREAALHWLERCGSADAMYHAARLHAELGRSEQADRWLQRAAGAGHVAAQQLKHRLQHDSRI
jgi:TPR repeat protein